MYYNTHKVIHIYLNQDISENKNRIQFTLKVSASYFKILS
ncbi:hypothetical protein SAMN04488116_0842 [Flagellimonas flava]|uniref:Uncharacterized protein n=1 Tax=Flagellimonas flava TaxID=570519 RepID=A0A1M5IP90_9FLAO|nr:hypothetical protein SAMN04488116_0842 [Allomuricauda flava]